MHPSRAFFDVDNFMRTHMDGKNPFWGKEWECMLQEALTIPGTIMTPIGEDSGFFDTLKAHGGAAAVDTDMVVGHVDDKTITPQDFINAARAARKTLRSLLGVYE